MTVGIKHVSEYNRQYRWREVSPDPGPLAGRVSAKLSEPALQANQRPTLELASKEELPEVVKTFGSPSKELHVVREPSFIHKKRVPGASPERIKVNKSAGRKAGLSEHVNAARYKSEYARNFSPKKVKIPVRPSSPVQNSKTNFVESKTNLPIGKLPVDRKVQSEYASRYQDPTSHLKYIRELYREEMRRKQAELDRVEERRQELERQERIQERRQELERQELERQELEREEAGPLVEEEGPGKAAKPPPPQPERKVKLKIVSPLKGDKPKIKATIDLISPQKPRTKMSYKSEYKSKFESPVKSKFEVPSAYGRRTHPYKVQTERVADLIKPDPSTETLLPQTTTVNWYTEVLELRKLAQQFKAKSHGSHFSPDKLGQIAYSQAQLRDIEPIVESNVSEESIRIVPTGKKSTKEVKEKNELPRPENDLQITDLEEECPNIENLVIKTKSLDDVSSPKTPSPAAKPRPKFKSPEKETDVTPRTADRSATLFAGRVATPKLKNQGSRHHFDRTTTKPRSEKFYRGPEEITAVLAGRVSTPQLQKKGGSRHHLDCTTPTPHIPAGTQPFVPLAPNDVQEKLDFSTPTKRTDKRTRDKRSGWTKDLDCSVLSRASSCSSLAGATLCKAKTRGADFWK